MPVSNASPLIHLAKLGKLGYMKSVFASILIPPAVRAETISAGRSEGYSDAIILEKLEAEGWLKTGQLSQQSKKLAVELSDAIGRGEAEAIALAVQQADRLFMDDLKGRLTAKFYRIDTTSTLAIILELLKAKAITWTEYQRNIKTYGSQGWISSDVIQEFLERGRDIE